MLCQDSKVCAHRLYKSLNWINSNWPPPRREPIRGKEAYYIKCKLARWRRLLKNNNKSNNNVNRNINNDININYRFTRSRRRLLFKNFGRTLLHLLPPPLLPGINPQFTLWHTKVLVAITIITTITIITFITITINITSSTSSPLHSRVWRTGTGNSRYREFLIFLVVSEPVSGKIGTGKKSRNWYRQKFDTAGVLLNSLTNNVSINFHINV